MLKGTSESLLFTALLAVGLAGCGADEKIQRLTSQEYGAAWPFTVSSVDLLCDGPSPKALARIDNGTIYALNGSARAIAKERGWADGQEITKADSSMPGVKMDFSDIVQRAQALCGSANL